MFSAPNCNPVRSIRSPVSIAMAAAVPDGTTWGFTQFVYKSRKNSSNSRRQWATISVRPIRFMNLLVFHQAIAGASVLRGGKKPWMLGWLRRWCLSRRTYRRLNLPILRTFKNTQLKLPHKASELLELS